MNSTQSNQSEGNADQQVAAVLKEPSPFKIKASEKKPLTLGQKVADKMAAKVGSWAFLIGQSTVLAGWVGCNLMPGVPHWDESPFILLNLVFSFASAYTAPVVLMSQNRQSEEDRESANHNYQVTLQAAHNLELLHEKLDAEYAKKLDELTVLIQQRQPTADEVKVVFVPTQNLSEFMYQPYKMGNPSLFQIRPQEGFFVSPAKQLDDATVRVK
jgi:uncharacterized membrane protein